MQFLDTNILLYTLDESVAEKFRIARQVLARRDWALSVQVLQEFYYQATRFNRKNRLSYSAATALVEDLCRFPLQPITPDLCRATIATHHRCQISYWDAAIIEAARALGCDTVLSEDLQAGQSFGGIVVVNPFTLPNH